VILLSYGVIGKQRLGLQPFRWKPKKGMLEIDGSKLGEHGSYWKPKENANWDLFKLSQRCFFNE